MSAPTICFLFTIGMSHSSDRDRLADKALKCAYALSNQSILQACDNNFDWNGLDVRNSSCEFKLVSFIRSCVFYCDELREAYDTRCEHLHRRKKSNEQQLWHQCMALSTLVDSMRCTPVYTAFDEMLEEMHTH